MKWITLALGALILTVTGAEGKKCRLHPLGSGMDDTDQVNLFQKSVLDMITRNCLGWSRYQRMRTFWDYHLWKRNVQHHQVGSVICLGDLFSRHTVINSHLLRRMMWDLDNAHVDLKGTLSVSVRIPTQTFMTQFLHQFQPDTDYWLNKSNTFQVVFIQVCSS